MATLHQAGARRVVWQGGHQNRSRGRAKSEGGTGQFAPIDLDSDAGLGGAHDDRFGPDVVLLCGFEAEEIPAVRRLLDELGATWVQVLVLEQRMLTMTQRDALALACDQSPDDALAAANMHKQLNLPRMAFLSGMSGAEAISVIDEFPMQGIAPPLFAGVTPKSYEKTLNELILEVQSDHEELVRQQQQSFQNQG